MPVIGMTSGVFDLFHYGHLHYIQRCRNQCDKLVVAVDSDEMARQVKGEGRPIMPQRERMKILDSLKCVTMVCGINSLEDLKWLSKAFRAQKVFKNEVFMNIHPVIGVEGCSAELIIVPDVPGLPESTGIINTVVERYGCLPGDSSCSSEE